MLQFYKFQKSYGLYLALNIGDVLIEPGIYWVKGVNGSGKSTLLKTVAGILSFDGDILIDGKYSVKKTPVAAMNFKRVMNLWRTGANSCWKLIEILYSLVICIFCLKN